MRMCMPHWGQLREAIKERGMMHLVAGTDEKAAQNMKGQLTGASERETFDPLMGANFAIYSNAMRIFGLYLMTEPPEGGHYCPVCESEKAGGHPAEWWITNAADEQLSRAVELGLVKVH